MASRRPPDGDSESGEPLRGFAVSATTTGGRKITLTETHDLETLEGLGEAEPSRRFALLVFCDGEAQVCLLDEETTAVVGREAPCEIVVSDSSISRQHARFSIRKSEVWVEDLDSRNGTLFRGRRIQRERLEPTDEIHVGRARLVLVATREGSVPASERHSKQASSDVVIVNPAMRTLYEQAARASRGSLPVLILGETGVGKEHVAAAFHRESDRRDGPFVVVNCAAIPSSLLEPTFFGHERGAFTGAVNRAIGVFERANGGVLFLDEIGELTLGAQAALLRAIETRRITRVGASTELAVDVRIVAATHCDLDAMVEDGTFRQDLFFRLNGVKLDVLPLRERSDEIEALVRLFVDRARQEWGARVRDVTREAMEVILRYGWPGNVRQLKNAVERAVLLCTSDSIGVSDLPDYVFEVAAQKSETRPPVSALPDLGLREQMLKYERALIEEALRRAAGNRRAAAKLLRIPVRTFFRKMRAPGGTEEPET